MRFAVTLLLALFSAAAVHAITIETVPVGDVGNSGYGGVNYPYSIGKYEVTVGQYTAFLNAVAATDTYGLYHTSMATDLNIAGIDRSGVAGSYTYTVIDSANHPITYVDWGDAARFANWLHNGQPTGPQNASTTEDGAYTLNGATSGSDLLLVIRNAGATWFLPNEYEWYKAAYYQPAAQGGDSDGYWALPMKTNSRPYSDQPPGATPDNTRVGNFRWDDGVANGYDDGFAVTGSTSLSSSQNYLTDVGAYTSSPSYYGTFDQAGNVYEWNETEHQHHGQILVHGGAWYWTYFETIASNYMDYAPNFANDTIGFRVASAPDPDDFGDFNHDDIVDTGDYIVWRSINGTQSDYNQWRANFGTVLSGAGSGTALSAVPEPSSALLAVSIFALLASRRSRR